MKYTYRLKIKWIGLLLVFLSYGFLISCQSKNQQNKHFPKIRVMTYNVENLFDAQHDPGKNDYTYLPKKMKTAAIIAHCPKHPAWRKACIEMDWNEARVQEKIKRLTLAIQKNAMPKGPEILLLQEVENKRILSRLQESLGSDYYQTIALIEGPDKRGIDTAILSSLPLGKEPKLHLIELPGKKRSRGVLEATLVLPNKQFLTVFSIHFPSQGNPKSHRIISLKSMNKIAAEFGKDHLLLVGGDSNVTKKEKWMWQRISEPLWNVSISFDIAGASGSHYYRGHWSFLDVFLFNNSLHPEKTSKSGYFVDTSSFKVGTAYDKQVYKTRKGTKIPNRYSHPKYYGVSDHFPVMVDLVWR